jgi:hypothetical protein
MRRILVTGDRNWQCFGLATTVIKKLVTESAPDEIVIVHGNCRGVDRSFRSACEFMNVKHEPHDVSPETWKKVGKGAGPARNTEMVKLGADVCLVFHPDLVASKGSRDCATKALAAGIPVIHCADGDNVFRVESIDQDVVSYKTTGWRVNP